MLGGDIAGTISTTIARLFILVIAFTIHEFAHAWTANRFGDDTPRLAGRLTLNPLVHLDPIGSLLLLVAGFGWAKPVPINPYKLYGHSRSAVMWVSLAGPLSNLAMAFLAALPFQLGLVSLSQLFMPQTGFLPTPAEFLYQFILINLVLFIFNLFPIAPLDGEKVIGYFLPSSWTRTMETLRPYGPLILMAVVFVGPALGFDVLYYVLWLPSQAMLNILVG
ncbi:MAG TPA: site-2 protease family protein [Anaerolineales bacterium]|nr:site-2 protease family protein [Anaerolineales bacterium]